MFSRSFSSLILPLSILVALPCALLAKPSPEDEAEAQRLFSRANDYVTNVAEDGYSYAYIQFYWKRAQANVERVARVYGDTVIGRQVKAGEVKLGPYALDYFRDRVLPRLEGKKLGAFDPVNCAIFLYNLDEKRLDVERTAALQGILEVLARQQRWSEALSFPVLKEQRPLLLATIFRVAARFEQNKVVDEILESAAAPEEQPALYPVLGEALALRGAPRTDIAHLLDEHPEDAVKLAILAGMVTREIKIQRTAALRIPLKKSGIQTVHYSVLHPEVRDDVDAVAQTFFPQPTEASLACLALYHAAQGKTPAASAPLDAQLAYLDYLAAFERFDEFATYPDSLHLDAASRQAFTIKQIELLAYAGRLKESDQLRLAFIAKYPNQSDAAALALFRGQMNSIEIPFTVREKTFSTLPIKDPCVLAQAIMDHSLAPNRAIRGAAPWDSVVQAFMPGFENLPEPKSKDVQDASSSSKPY